AISNIINTKSKDVELGVDQRNRHDPLTQDRERILGDLPKDQLGDIARRKMLRVLGEGVEERQPDLIFDLAGTVERHRAAEVTAQRPNIVQSEQMVGVVMGEEYRLDSLDFFT